MAGTAQNWVGMLPSTASLLFLPSLSHFGLKPELPSTILKVLTASVRSTEVSLWGEPSGLGNVGLHSSGVPADFWEARASRRGFCGCDTHTCPVSEDSSEKVSGLGSCILASNLDVRYECGKTLLPGTHTPAGRGVCGLLNLYCTNSRTQSGRRFHIHASVDLFQPIPVFCSRFQIGN